MRNKFFKSISAAALALAVTATAITGVKLVSEAGHARAGCPHTYTTTYRGILGYEAANSEYHWVSYYEEETCNDCWGKVDNRIYIDEGYEPHDLSGYSNGNWVCVDCGYEETPGQH